MFPVILDFNCSLLGKFYVRGPVIDEENLNISVLIFLFSKACIDTLFLPINPIAVIWPEWRQVSRCDF